MKFFYIFGILFFFSVLIDVFVSIETQDDEKKTDVKIKPSIEEENTDLNKDNKKPFILIGEGWHFTFPICVFIGKKKPLIYTMSDRKDTYFFCPPEQKLTDELENCIFPSKNDSCTKPVEPLIVPDLTKEGKHLTCSKERGKLYSFGFQPCLKYSGGLIDNGHRNPYPLGFKAIYKFCYDHKNEQVLYVFRKFHSPKLAENPLLEAERKSTHILRTNDFNLFKNRFEEIKPSFSKEKLDESGQVMQYIVPPEDLAFWVWKQTAYHFVNVKSVLKKTAQLLEHINHYIRQKAMLRLGEIRIADGFQPLDSSEVSIWWKIVYAENISSAIAIVIHNTEKQLPPKEKLCTESICEKYNWKGLIPNDMVSHAYCCLPKDIIQNNDLPIAKSPLNPDNYWKKLFKSMHHFHRLFC